jgi:hypothetical protein
MSTTVNLEFSSVASKQEQGTPKETTEAHQPVTAPETPKSSELIGFAPAFAEKVAIASTRSLHSNKERQEFLDNDISNAIREATLELFPVLAEQNFREIGYHSLTLQCERKDQATEADLQRAEEEHVIQHLKAGIAGYEALYDAFQADQQADIANMIGLSSEHEDFQQAYPQIKQFCLDQDNQVAIAKLVAFTSLLHDAKEADGRKIHEDNAVMLSALLKNEQKLDYTVNGWDLYPLVVAGIEASRMNTKIPPEWKPREHSNWNPEWDRKDHQPTEEELSQQNSIFLKEFILLNHMTWTHRADYERNTSPGYYDTEALTDTDKLKNQAMLLLTGEALIEMKIEEQIPELVPEEKRTNLVDAFYHGDPVEMMSNSAKFTAFLSQKFEQVDHVIQKSELASDTKERILLKPALQKLIDADDSYSKSPDTLRRTWQAALMVAQQETLSPEQAQQEVPELQQAVQGLITQKQGNQMTPIERYQSTLKAHQTQEKAGL